MTSSGCAVSKACVDEDIPVGRALAVRAVTNTAIKSAPVRMTEKK
jgi:hypothetical protein